MEADQNKIVGKEIAVAKALYGQISDKKTGYVFKQALTVAQPALDQAAVDMSALTDCIKQLEAMGEYDEVLKAQGGDEGGYKATGLVIVSKKDPRVKMSVEFGRRWNKDSDQQQLQTGDKDVTLKWFLDDENLDREMGKGAVPERSVAPEELDVITKAREASKEVKVKTESKEVKKLAEDNVAKPVEHEVTVKLTLKEAAEALGYLSGRGAWKVENDYLDADRDGDVYHGGYSAKDVQNINTPNGMDDVEKIFPIAVATAMESAERAGLAAAITKDRYRCIENALEKIDVVGEYQSTDGGMVSCPAAIVSAKVDAPKDEVTIVIKNPEHLINDIVNGVGRFAPEIDSYVEASDEEIKNGLMSCLGDYFEVYGERKPEVSDRLEGDFEESYFKEEIEVQLSDMSAEDIAQCVVDSVDEGRMDNEKEAAKVAAKLTKNKFKEIMTAVAKIHAGAAERHQGKAKDAEGAEESVQVGSEQEESIEGHVGSLLGESMKKEVSLPATIVDKIKSIKPLVEDSWAQHILDSGEEVVKTEKKIMGESTEKKTGQMQESVDFFGMPVMEEVAVAPQQKKATSPLVHKNPQAMDKLVASKKKELGGETEPNKAGEHIGDKAKETPLGVKSGEKNHSESDIKVGDVGDDHGDHVEGKGKSQKQEKDLPSAKIKLGKPGDDSGKHMQDSRRVAGKPVTERKFGPKVSGAKLESLQKARKSVSQIQARKAAFEARIESRRKMVESAEAQKKELAKKGVKSAMSALSKKLPAKVAKKK
jgi:hypothetical protein